MQYKKLLSLFLISSLSLTACGGGGGSDSGGSEPPPVTDSDGDGVADSDDAFPDDASETTDSDGDGVGDNADVFPNDATETTDTDGDGVGDNADVFPDDATETLDSDEDGVGDNADYAPNDPSVQTADQSKYEGVCTPSDNTVNFAALLAEDCEYLSAYNLFSDATNPTKDVLGSKSLPYALSTELFTDYASKYRFVVMPEDSSATYTENEVFELPVGTVLIKTFSMPSDTGTRGFENETILETRLLIHREEGWDALPFIWDENGTDAKLNKYGKFISQSVTHKGTTEDFTYIVPTKSDCKQCHQLGVELDGNGDIVSGSGTFSPIGPKARLLNYDFDYDAGSANQISTWVANNMLSGAPSDLSNIKTVPNYKDSDADGLAILNPEALTELAKGYLDINCAHCHRPEGSASNSGFHVEYWRDFSSELTKHGYCKTPIAFSKGVQYDLEPGMPDDSNIYFRMNTADPELRMPEIGRSLIHHEGVELMEAWISILDEAPYSLSACSSN